MSSNKEIPFNKPFLTGKEEYHISEVIKSKKLCGNGNYTFKCHNYFKEKYGFKECYLTTSCTDALEMTSILIDIQPGDEVIMPSYTFVSSANPYILRGAKVIFADSRDDHPGMDEDTIEALITPKTKAIVVVHYAGVATDMDKVMAIAEKHDLYVIEDAAQAIDAYYKGRPLGSIGHFGALSFHETKNIVCGEGGLLIVNDERFVDKAEIIREKGTDRSKFLRGEINKYGWVAVGSSFLPSELVAGFLYAQLQELEAIQAKRVSLWKAYHEELKPLAASGKIVFPAVPEYASKNGHLFYIVLKNEAEQTALRIHLKGMGISAVFHYNPLHRSKFYIDKHDGRVLKNSDKYDTCLLRLPLYPDLDKGDIQYVADAIKAFFE